jgi:hypothetical protein
MAQSSAAATTAFNSMAQSSAAATAAFSFGFSHL